MWNYFDLNLRYAKSRSSKTVAKRGMLSAENGTATHEATSERSQRLSIWQQLLMYVGTVIGVFFSSAVRHLKEGIKNSPEINVTTVVLSSVVSLMLLPIVYEKLKMQPESPWLIRFGVFVQQGVFWNVLFEAMGKVIT